MSIAVGVAPTIWHDAVLTRPLRLLPRAARMPDDFSSPASIEFERVAYTVAAQTEILHDLSLRVQPGETVVLLGRSGSGKTTTLKMINRLLEPSSGRVSVEGKSTLDWDPIRLRRRIGYVIQDVGLFPHFTVAENVGVVPSLEGLAPERILERTRAMLELAGLPPDDFSDRYPHELSGGQRQRVGVARSLAGEPAILLLDEPFGALDPITRREIRAEFSALRDQVGITMVFVTHDVAEAFLLADRIGLMQGGTLVACLPPDEFRDLEALEAQLFMEGLGG